MWSPARPRQRRGRPCRLDDVPRPLGERWEEKTCAVDAPFWGGWLIMVNQWLVMVNPRWDAITFLMLRASDPCWLWKTCWLSWFEKCVFLVYVQLDKANIREYSDRRLKALRVEVIVSLSMGSMFTVLMFWHPYNLWLCSDLSSNHSKIQGHYVWMILNVFDPFLFGLSLNSIRSTAKSTHVRQGLSLMGTLKR